MSVIKRVRTKTSTLRKTYSKQEPFHHGVLLACKEVEALCDTLAAEGKGVLDELDLLLCDLLAMDDSGAKRLPHDVRRRLGEMLTKLRELRGATDASA